MVNSEELIGTKERVTLYTRYRLNRVRLCVCVYKYIYIYISLLIQSKKRLLSYFLFCSFPFLPT
jgi:hypothetical protein